MKDAQISVMRDSTIIAGEINLIKEQTNKILLQSSIEIGKRLVEAKELVGHGNWHEWLEHSVNYSKRTASNLIKIYEEYGVKMLESSNRQALADLGYTQAVAILRLNFEERENFVLEHDVENMSTRELDEAIKEKNEVIKQKAILEERIKDILKEKETLSTKLDSQKDHITTYEEEKENQQSLSAEQEKRLKELNKKLKEAERLNKELETQKTTAEVDPENLKALEDKLKKSDSQIKELKEQLKEKPKEVVKEVEVVPETTKLEIESLKSKLHASESTVKYKATFQVIITLFDELITTLNEIKAVDHDQYIKYQGATNKLLDQLKQ